MRLVLTQHARDKMRERKISAADIRHILERTTAPHPTKKPRPIIGRDVSGRRLKIVYVQAKQDVFRVVTAVVVN